MSQQHKAPGPSNKASWKLDIKRPLQLKSFLRERGHRSYLGRHTGRKSEWKIKEWEASFPTMLWTAGIKENPSILVPLNKQQSNLLLK